MQVRNIFTIALVLIAGALVNHPTSATKAVQSLQRLRTNDYHSTSAGAAERALARVVRPGTANAGRESASKTQAKQRNPPTAGIKTGKPL
ncbi:hypothetical protein FI667_g9091, partial [Globisporangium splendens]